MSLQSGRRRMKRWWQVLASEEREVNKNSPILALGIVKRKKGGRWEMGVLGHYLPGWRVMVHFSLGTLERDWIISFSQAFPVSSYVVWLEETEKGPCASPDLMGKEAKSNESHRPCLGIWHDKRKASPLWPHRPAARGRMWQSSCESTRENHQAIMKLLS